MMPRSGERPGKDDYIDESSEFNKPKPLKLKSETLPPPPLLGRVIKDGVGRFCDNCGSTMSRDGCLGLYGNRYCDNDDCYNSKKIRLKVLPDYKYADKCAYEFYNEKRQPFTPEEQDIMDLLVLAHNKITDLGNHKNDVSDWVNHLHGCQSVLISRVVRRDYPDVFN